jgi:cell volume regulation protein A
VGVTDQLIFLAGSLLTLSILATVPADRSGVPLLVVFLGIGMLAGALPLDGLDLRNVATAHLLGTTALAVILFDGGLHTPLSSFRTGLGPGVMLATVGVILTTAVAAAVFHAWLGLAWPEAMLLAAMVSSTDAAAVFYLLRARGIELYPRVRNTLEIESGINDPLAIFLTLAVIEWLTRDGGATGTELISMFVLQLGAGAGVGVLGGWLLTLAINRCPLSTNLYPLQALAGGLLVYGSASLVGGSGFLAAYLAGLILGNRARVARRAIQRFHDGVAWLCQIGLFLLLGLLVMPGELIPVADRALIAAGVLILLARPVAVAVCLLPFRFSWRQMTFMSWVGLRGGVPVVLSLYPLMAGVGFAPDAFNLIFFIVLVSLTLQGWTVGPLARRLGLLLPREHPDTTRIDLDRPADHELVVCELPDGSPATRGSLGDLEPPDGVRLIAMVRGDEARPPAPDLLLHAGDTLYLVVPTVDTARQERFDHWLDAVGTAHPVQEQAYFGEFAVDAGAPMADFVAIYLLGAAVQIQEGESVGDYLQRRLRHRASEGDQVRLQGVVLVVREMDGGTITTVGVRLPRDTA